MDKQIIESKYSGDAWLDVLGQPVASRLLAWEQQQADELLADVFGYHAVQLGWPALHALRSNRMPHRWVASDSLREPELLALPAVVIGGMQSIPGAIIGGILVGVVEQLAATYISPKSSDIVIYGLLLVILMVRPWGLFGQKELGRV